MVIKRNLLGQVFGKLTVISENPIRGLAGHVMWNCQCECGNTITKPSANLVNGHTQSCGCLRREIHTTHGMSHYPEYHIWEGIIQRCTNPNFKQYEDYGGRGITVCEEWLNSFETFYRDVGSRPSPELTLDRDDNDKGYEPGNCFWRTRGHQVNNRRNNVFYEYAGQKYQINQLAELPEVKNNGIGLNTLKARIRNSGWDVEDAINIPLTRVPKTYTYNGITKTISEWSKEYNINYDTLYSRLIQLNWSFETAVKT
jgi:hypothetical protein